MSAPRQHGFAALLVATLVLAACSSTSSGSPAASTSAPAPAPVDMPVLRIPGLRVQSAQLDAEGVAAEATDPATLSETLTASGFESVTERTLTGRRGVFSRVVLRAWVFSSEQGATTFLDWLHSSAADLIGEAEPVKASVPSDVRLQMHTPSGCCHEEVPIYLASWQRDAIVWTIRASGARIHTPPVVALVRSIAQGG
jgi:hypothetical protein